MPFIPKLVFSDGEEIPEDDQVFDTEEDALDHGATMLGEWQLGAEILHEHNHENPPLDELTEPEIGVDEVP